MSSLASNPTAPPLPAPAAAAPAVDVVVPVFDEAAGVERSVRRLHRFLTDELPFSWRIVVADNGSSDATVAIAERLAGELPACTCCACASRGSAARCGPPGRRATRASSRSERRPLAA